MGLILVLTLRAQKYPIEMLYDGIQRFALGRVFFFFCPCICLLGKELKEGHCCELKQIFTFSLFFKVTISLNVRETNTKNLSAFWFLDLKSFEVVGANWQYKVFFKEYSSKGPKVHIDIFNSIFKFVKIYSFIKI